MIDQKQIIFLFIESLLNKDLMKDILANPSQPTVEIQVGDVLLPDQLTEEEKFFYSLLPSPSNGGKTLIVEVTIIDLLYHLWWTLISMHHHILGPIGVRVGWQLVIPKRKEDPLTQILEGRFEFNPRGVGPEGLKC